MDVFCVWCTALSPKHSLTRSLIHALAHSLFPLFVTVTFVALNCVYVKYVTKVQTFLSSTKLIALLIIVVGGIYRMAMGEQCDSV